MNEELKRIFGNGITVGQKVVPASHLKYKGSSKSYIVWTITSESPQLSADDEYKYGVATVDVDVYDEGNYTDTITEIKRLMKTNDWIWTEDSTEMYDEETNLYHKTITFEKEV